MSGAGEAGMQRSPSAATKPCGRAKTFALALGAGGARSLAGIAVVEALDALGVRPVAISGSSLGALIGAAYAAGITGKEMRRHALAVAHDRSRTFTRLGAARTAPLSTWLTAPWGNPMLVNAGKFCEAFLPPGLPADFSDLQIPLTIVATDLYARSEFVFTAGPLQPALSASMAIPGLVEPVELAGRILVDGAALNPLPFDHLRGCADIIVAIDCSGAATPPSGIPDPWDCLFMTLQVMSQTIVASKLAAGAPDLVIRPNVGSFRLLDFFHASAILRAADPIKAQIEKQLGALLND